MSTPLEQLNESNSRLVKAVDAIKRMADDLDTFLKVPGVWNKSYAWYPIKIKGKWYWLTNVGWRLNKKTKISTTTNTVSTTFYREYGTLFDVIKGNNE